MYAQTSQNSDALIAAIQQFPQEWALTPCIGKCNLWSNWPHEKLDRAQLIEAIRTSKNADDKHIAWTGVSIVTGSMSGGIMAIDFDGIKSIAKYYELSEEATGKKQPIPTTKRWTSGRTGHFQILLAVPESEWEGLQAKTKNCGEGEKLELRWNQCSTLPPSIHPDTGKPYTWIEEGAIAECPEFILQLMRKPPAVVQEKFSRIEHTPYIDATEKTLVDIYENEILPRLDAEQFYGEWVALKKSGQNFVGLCPYHNEKTPSFTVSSENKLFKCFGGCDAAGGPAQFFYQIGKGGTGSPMGADFAEVVRELADRVGVSMPEFHPRTQNLKSNSQHQKSNLLTHPKFEAPDTASLESEIQELFTLDLKRSQIQLRIAELAKTYRLPSGDIWKIYREQEQEQEQEADRPDVATEIESLLSAHKTSISLIEVLPAGLAAPIEKLAAMLNLRSECYLLALLTQTASLFKVGTETILRRDTDWRCVPNYNGGIVAEVSQLKTPIPKAIIDRPMRALRERAQKEFEQAQLNYETELNNWKASKKEEDRGPEPKPPKIRVYTFDKTTGEAIIYQQAEFPEQAMMFFCDELAGILKSANQYRGGKGSDEEDMLSFWNGTGTTVLRASGVRASVEAVGLSVFGTIQPDVLAGLLKDCSDSNGKFARFDFVFQPLAVPNLPEDDSGRFDLTPMLTDLYQKIDSLPAICFEFTKEARDYHRVFSLACHERRVVEPRQGIRGALGKMPEKVGKLATTIHTLNCVFNGQEVTNQIPRSAVEAAVKFVKFAADQVASLYTEFSDRTALAPNLTKILLTAERKGGGITIREAQLAFNSKFRPTAQVTRSWFAELVALGYGVVKKSGKTLIFQNTRRSDDQFLQTPPNVVTASVLPTDLRSISVDQFLQTSPPTDPSDHQVIHEVIQSPPLQGKGYRRIVGTDPRIDHFEKKSPTDEDAKANLSFSTEEVVTVPTILPQSQQALSFEVDHFVMTVGDSSYSLNETEIELLEMLQKVVAEEDSTFAQDIQQTLKETCDLGHADREKVWAALGNENQKIFKELLAAEVSEEADAEELNEIEQLLAVETLVDFEGFAEWVDNAERLEKLCLGKGGQSEIFWLAYKIQNFLNFEDKAAAVEELTNFRDRFSKEVLEVAVRLAVGNQRGESSTKLKGLVLASKVELADAKAMREIALFWWEKMPMENLITQLFARNCPGAKYAESTKKIGKVLAAWIGCQETLVRDRLLQVCRACDRAID